MTATNSLIESDSSHTSDSRTHIAPSIYEKIVYRCLESIPGVVTARSHAHTGMSATKVSGSSLPKIHIELQEYDNPAALPSCTVSLRIAVFWPCPLAHLVHCVQEAVIQHLRAYTDMIALSVDVDIASVLPDPSQRITVEDIENYKQRLARPEPVPIKGEPLSPQPLSIPQLSGQGMNISSPPEPSSWNLSPLPTLVPITPWISPEVVTSYSDLPIHIESPHD